MRPYLYVKKLKGLDGFFAISFSLGTALSFLTSWLISAVFSVEFSTPLFAAVLLFLSLTALFVPVVKNNVSMKPCLKDCFKAYIRSIAENARRLFLSDMGRFLAGFAIFALIFLLAVYVKGFKPEITYDTEKYMDFGFVNSIYRQKSAFPEDMWFSGENLNYYFLGQACTAFLCRLSAVTPDYGYNFMLCTIIAIVAMCSFSITEAFLRCTLKERITLNTKTIPTIIGGVTAALLNTLACNFHYVIYGIIWPLIEKITGLRLRNNDYGYFFPDSTTYIGYFPDLPDKGKNEFPAYSFVLGDLHAHFINLIFVLPLILIVLDYVLSDREGETKTNAETKSNSWTATKIDSDANKPRWISAIEPLLDIRLVLTGILLGLYKGTNFWDFPIYLVVAGGLILFSDCYKNGINIKTIIGVLEKGALVILISTLVILPFSLNFEKMASVIKLAQNHSQFYKMVVLWGFPVLVCTLYFALRCRELWSVKNCSKRDRIVNEELSFSHSDLCLLALSLCAFGLTIIPEIVYVEDIYGLEYARFNTMFKLTYQAFLIFSICIGIIVGNWIAKGRRVLYTTTILVTIVLSTYTVKAVHQYMGNVFEPDKRKGICATDFLYEDSDLFPEAVAANILASDDRKIVHVLEAAGDSYSPDCKLSVFSGSCTVVGWQVHEYMWHGEWDKVGLRVAEVAKFYSGGDKQYCSDFVEKYKLDYIYAGPRECEKYRIDTSGFADMCEAIPLPGDGVYVLYKVIK